MTSCRVPCATRQVILFIRFKYSTVYLSLKDDPSEHHVHLLFKGQRKVLEKTQVGKCLPIGAGKLVHRSRKACSLHDEFHLAL